MVVSIYDSRTINISNVAFCMDVKILKIYIENITGFLDIIILFIYNFVIVSYVYMCIVIVL